MQKIQWKNETRLVKDLLPADYNPREMTSKEEEDLRASIEEFDAVVPVVINIGKRGNVLIGGHQRVTIYGQLGIEEIDVRVPNRELTTAEEKRLNLRLNRNTGHFVQEKLKEMGIELLIDVGFDEEDMSAMFDDVDIIDDAFDVQARTKKMTAPITAPGDVWQLGDHRLMVGDSTNPEDVAKLMGKDKADMIYCDPPYNIGIDYSKGTNTGPKQKEKRVFRTEKASYGNDNMKDDRYYGFLSKTLVNALQHANKDVHTFYWCDERYIGLIQRMFVDQGIDSKRVCMWVKNNFSLTPQIAFNKVYEPCVYGVKGSPYLNKNIKNLNEILNKEVESGNQVHDEIMSYVTLWIEKRDSVQEYEHPTQKPITLHEKPLKRCTGVGHVVIDLFGGSGSTLIACEQLKRRARLMEIDPIFATVIIERWENFTNKKAKRI